MSADNNFKEMSKEVYYSTDDIAKLSKKDINFLKEKMLSNNLQRIRICAHKGIDDKIHEMFIVLRKSTYIRPHKHLNKSESFHLVEGRAKIVVFDSEGNIKDVICVDNYDSGEKFYYRMNNAYYHTVLAMSDFLVFHEIVQGPFKKEDTIFAPWAPKEGNKERENEYRERLLEDISTMEQNHFKRTTCRLCYGTNLELVVPITATPIADAYVSKDQLNETQELYPLDMYQCRDCGHVQLLDVVNPKILFSHYSYFSGKSAGLVKHFEEYASNVIDENELKEDSFVVDIGSNDGVFLKFFKEKGIRVLGIDPAENVSKFANESGIETLPEMFDLKLAEKIRKNYGPADVVTANNVFAHTDDMHGMANAVRKLLADDAVFIFEVSYFPDVIDKMLLGTIFHEHVCYHTVKPLKSFLRNQNMELIDVKRVSVQGGSIIGTAQLAGGRRRVSSSVGKLIQLEESRGIYKPGGLREFSERLENVKSQIAILLRDLKAQGKTIAGFGAARGGTLLMYHFNLGKILDYIVDDNPDKQGLYSPGYHIPVLPTSAIYERNPDYIFILAWVHSKLIIKSHQAYLDKGGKFITCFPEIEVIQNK